MRDCKRKECIFTIIFVNPESFLTKTKKYSGHRMFFFFHLLTGLVLGYLLGDLLHDRRWFLPCTVGAVLPDIIDKFIGHILFPTTIGYGRIYAHTLLAALLVLAIGLIFWKLQSDPGVFALGIGMFSHGILDMMWRQTVNWYWPLLGPFQGKLPADYFFTLLARELSNPFEWVIALALGIGLVALWYREKISVFFSKNRPVIAKVVAAGAVLLCILSGIIIGRGFTGQKFIEIGWSYPDELIIGGIVLALAAYVLWRWKTVLSEV